ncbi:MAG: hypothetical protein AAF570_21655, partial [Bacteroidota bacterium]
MNSTTLKTPLHLVAVISFCFILLFGNALFGQIKRNYNLQFNALSFVPAANFSEAMQEKEMFRDKGQQVAGQQFKLLQFHDIPSEETKQRLRDLDVQLLHYVRNYAWLTAFPADFDPAQLQGFQVRYIGEITAEHKLERRLAQGDFPSHALPDADHVRLDLSYFRLIPAEVLSLQLHNLGVEVHAIKRKFGQMDITAPIAALPDVAALPAVYFVQSAAPPAQAEQEVNRSSHRSNFIAADHPAGLHFIGNGVTLAVSEGMADTTDIDWHGRLDPSYHFASGFSGHATGVMRRMAGAGNYNPVNRGMSFGSDLITVPFAGWDYPMYYNNDSVRAMNHSYGYGCSYGYNTASVE